jgi:hypothetical protein
MAERPDHATERILYRQNAILDLHKNEEEKTLQLPLPNTNTLPIEQSPVIQPEPAAINSSPNVLSGDNEVDVDIEPDVKNNATHIHLCSCSVVFNCFTRNSVAKN